MATGLRGKSHIAFLLFGKRGSENCTIICCLGGCVAPSFLFPSTSSPNNHFVVVCQQHEERIEAPFIHREVSPCILIPSPVSTPPPYAARGKGSCFLNKVPSFLHILPNSQPREGKNGIQGTLRSRSMFLHFPLPPPPSTK